VQVIGKIESVLSGGRERDRLLAAPLTERGAERRGGSRRFLASLEVNLTYHFPEVFRM
jgi:hypothetical protein